MALDGMTGWILPSVVVGLLLLGTAGVLVRLGPASWPSRLLVWLLVLRGLLNVLAPLWFIDPLAVVARHAWPALDVLVATVGVLWLLALWAARFEAPTWRWLPLVLAVGGVVLASVLAWRPELYWGTDATDGPWAMANGVKFVVYGAVSLLLVWGYVEGVGGRFRHAGLTVGLAFALNVAHWAAADLLFVEGLDAGLSDVRASPDHFGRLFAWVPLLLLVGLLVRDMRRHEVDHVQEGCTFALLALAVPVLVVVALALLFAFGVVGAVVTNHLLVLVLDAVWTVPVVIALLMLLRHGRPSLHVLLGPSVRGAVEAPPATRGRGRGAR